MVGEGPSAVMSCPGLICPPRVASSVGALTNHNTPNQCPRRHGSVRSANDTLPSANWNTNEPRQNLPNAIAATARKKTISTTSAVRDAPAWRANAIAAQKVPAIACAKRRGRRCETVEAGAPRREPVVQRVERIPPRHERAPKENDRECREHLARPQDRGDEPDHADDTWLNEQRGGGQRARRGVGFVEPLLQNEIAIDARRFGAHGGPFSPGSSMA